MQSFTKLASSLTILSVLSACAAGPAPRNLSDSQWMTEQGQRHATKTTRHNNLSCIQPGRPRDLLASNFVEPQHLPGGSEVLSVGDRIRVTVAGDKDVLTGTYVLSEDGNIYLPQLLPIAISGKNILTAERTIRSRLISGGFVRAIGGNVDVRLIENSGVTISISGAVFQPGSVRVGDRRAEDRIGQKEGLASGDTNPGRTVSAALQASGGVRPDAAIDSVYLVRAGKWTQLNLSGSLDGSGNSNRPVGARDRLIVPSKKCFNPDLVRPSAITAPGIRVFMSNLARSANNNAGAAIGEKTTSLPYGTRLLQGAIALNCIGGSAMNAGRKVILISRNPINGQSVVTERKVEDLVRRADRDAYNPFLMPNDSLACYDSAFMNFRDALGLVTDTATPALIFGNIGK